MQFSWRRSLCCDHGDLHLNYLVVRRFFLRPINDVLEARETETKTAEKLYEDALARFNEATAQTEAQLHTAKREAAQLRDRYRGEAGAYRQQVVERTSTEARQIVSEADTKLSADVAAARTKIVTESTRSLVRAEQSSKGRLMRRSIVVLLILAVVALADLRSSPGRCGGRRHHEKTYFGIPA
jgi:F0F1-type ATP synthase membrane subunit b/b'